MRAKDWILTEKTWRFEREREREGSAADLREGKMHLRRDWLWDVGFSIGGFLFYSPLPVFYNKKTIFDLEHF